MSQDEFTYFTYHCYPKALKRVRLYKDDEDKFAFISILAKTCLDLDLGLFDFDVINTHSHFMVGLKWFSDTKPEQNWLYHQIKYFIWNVNRRYGDHYRSKYKHKGDIYAKNKDNFKPVLHTNDFKNKVCYVHNNANFAGVFPVFEENRFNSYNYYLAMYVQNKEFQNLPVLRQITSSNTTLDIFNALDHKYVMKQFCKGNNFLGGVTNFFEAHRKVLYERDCFFKNRRSTNAYNNLGLQYFYEDTSLLQISKGQGHKVKAFIESLGNSALNRENIEEYFHTFSDLFSEFEEHSAASGPASSAASSSAIGLASDLASSLASGPASGRKETFSLIRKNHPTEFNAFVKAAQQNISVRAISRATGLCREIIERTLRE